MMTLCRALLVVPFLIFLGGAQSLAQTPTDSISLEEALQICAGVKNAKDRLDCFEGLAVASKSVSQETGQSSAAEAPVASDAQTDPNENTPPLAGGETSQASNEKPTEADEPSDSENTETVTATESQRFIIVPAKKDKEYVVTEKTPGQQRKKYASIVRRAWLNGEERLFLLLDTGELYKQIGNAGSRPPKPGDSVELRPGVIGGWFVELKKGYPATRMSLINKSQ